MRSPHDPAQTPESRPDESAVRDTNGGDKPNERPGAPRTRGHGRQAQPWGLAFALFLVGFVGLIVLTRVNLSRPTGDVLRVLAAALCVSAFLIARRNKKPR